MKQRHAFVLGSGIAGLSLAEVLSRNGWRITVLETAAELGGDASRSTQNWFHTGWLYAALPSTAAMLGCHRALRLFQRMYGGLLSPEVLNLAVGNRSLHYPASTHGWFSAERVHYLYATATAEISPAQRVRWKRHLQRVAFPRLRSLGYDVEPSSAFELGLVELLNYWEGDDPCGHEKYLIVRSTDAQINTRRVLDTLLQMLGRETEVIRSAQYTLSSHGERTAICVDGELHTPDLVVMATGKSIARQLRELGRESEAKRFKSVCSPIVVLRRALDLPNFIRFTPRLPTTVNHIKYEVAGVGLRSTLGSHDYYPAGEVPDISPFAHRICKRLGISSNDVADMYYGTKTELTGTSQRRYNHALERVNTNTYFAIPGKFSQFPLLAHEFAKRLGLATGLPARDRGRLELEVSPTAAERCHVVRTLESSVRGA